jgi:PGF-pre-PGF domain-containing protein
MFLFKDLGLEADKMKIDFLNSIICVLLVTLIIPGLTPGLVSALDDQLGDGGNSTTNSNLIIEISTDIKHPKPSDSVTINVNVKNTGDAASDSTFLVCTIDDGVTPIQEYHFIDSIVPGDERLIVLSPWTPGKEGTVTIRASLQGLENSQNQISVNVIENQLPDLIIESIVPKTSSPPEGKPLDFTVRIKNKGIATSGEALAKYYVNEMPGQDINVSALTEGESTSVSFSLPPDQVKAGTMQIRVFVDSGNTVSESDETNNEFTIPIPIKALLPDLTIESLSWSPEAPKAGDNIAFTAIIKNNGPGASLGSKLKYSVNITNETGEVMVPALAAGETTKGNFSWTPANEGYFEIKAVVDADAVVSESAEANNAVSKTVTVTQADTSNDDDDDSGSSSGSSSSSSSGGGGMLSREPPSNIAAKELATMNVVSGNHIKYDFMKNNTCILYIEYDAQRTFMKTTTTVEELKNRSTFVSKDAPGRIYKNVNIWVGDKGGGLPASLKNGAVEFKVEKAWIKNNNANESLIALQWYNNSNWEPLHTEKVAEDDNQVYFKSQTPGFSSFAITENTLGANKSGSQVVANSKNLQIKGKEAKNESAKNSKADEARKVAKVLMPVLLLLFLIFVQYFVVKKKL